MTEENKKMSELPEDMPIELQLDLLVDEELSEERRKALLRSMDKMPARWRELSIRFLERQVERKSARQLITAGKIADMTPQEREIPASLPFPNPRSGALREWWNPLHLTGIAAGLLVALGIGLIGLHQYRAANHGNIAVGSGGDAGIRLVDTQLPRSVVGTEIPVQVSVVDMPRNSRQTAFFPDNMNDLPGSRRSVVIQPDGIGNALIIPVKNLQIQ